MTTVERILAANGDAVKIAAILAEERERSQATGGIKISEKGAVSVYSLGRFPVTLYGEQWKALNKRMPEIMAFVEANESKLAKKADKA